jgi:hypothetical protein
MRERMPIMRSVLIDHIPMAMLAPHEGRAMESHGQSLDRLAERGGLSVKEAIALLEDRRWSREPASIEDDRTLINMVRTWRAING